MYIYTPLCRYWITLYRYVLVFIVPHVDIELEDNKQFISNIPRICLALYGLKKINHYPVTYFILFIIFFFFMKIRSEMSSDVTINLNVTLLSGKM